MSNKFLTMQEINSFRELLNKFQSKCLTQSPIIFNISQQIPFLRILHDKIKIILILHNLIELDNVVMVDRFKDSNLFVDHG